MRKAAKKEVSSPVEDCEASTNHRAMDEVEAVFNLFCDRISESFSSMSAHEGAPIAAQLTSAYFYNLSTKALAEANQLKSDLG